MSLTSTVGLTLSALAVVLVAACANNKPPAASTPPPAEASEITDGGSDEDAEEPAFAGSPAEATNLITASVDKKGQEIGLCVREFRLRHNLATERVSVSFGIDQEGTLLGVTSKGKEDDQLKTCVREALRGAKFPRSHAGVITVTKTYGEIIQ